MPEVANELMFELLKNIHADLGEMKQDMRALKVRMTATQEALAGVNRRLDRHDARLERIEHRLQLGELAEAAAPYDPRP